MLIIRTEQEGDALAIHAVHRAAFPTDVEARLVDRLRARGQAPVSLVALQGGQIVGHVLFSPVSLSGPAPADMGLGLAPVAVLPEHQRRGIGAALIREGLEACRRAGWGYVVVLGQPAYYARFGFRPASVFQLPSAYDAGDAFMALELLTGALPAAGGLIRYAPAFAQLG